MKPLLLTAAVAVVLVSAGGRAQVARLQIKAVSGTDVRAWDTYISQGERSGDLRVRSTTQDPLLPNRTVERYQQFHLAVPIWGAEIIRDRDRGATQAVFGEIVPNVDVDTQPLLSASDAADRLRGLIQRGGHLLNDPQLVVLPDDAGMPRLAYQAGIAANGLVIRGFIDAHDGSEIRRDSELCTVAAVGQRQGVLGDLKKLSVSQEAGAYFADDQLRPPLLRTFDLRNNLLRALDVIDGVSGLSLSDRATDPDNQWGDPVAVDAHAHIGFTYDYYYKRFGRRGLDDRDRPITALINGISARSALLLPGSLLDFALNAFWCGVCGPGGSGIMYFGNGLPQDVSLSGQTYGPFAGALDIVGHELTHGVIDSSSRLAGRGESGALNEAFADMMGTSVEFLFQTRGDGPGKADYLLGEDAIRGAFTAVHGIRSLENPQLYRQGGRTSPDHYSRRYVGPDDDGGEHINAGIPGQAFFLAIEGGTNRTSGIVVQGVGPANREQIEKVYYRAFTLLLPPNATFSMARATTAKAAQDLYGVGGAVERAVTQAWTAVGVF